MRRTTAILATLALLAGCGGDDEGGGGGGGADTGAATTQQQPAQASAEGEQIFTQNCGSCHVLAAANTTGTTGPNLDQVKPSQDETARQVTNGGGGMPAFRGRLSDAQIQAVAQYVAQSAGGG